MVTKSEKRLQRSISDIVKTRVTKRRIEARRPRTQEELTQQEAQLQTEEIKRLEAGRTLSEEKETFKVAGQTFSKDKFDIERTNGITTIKTKPQSFVQSRVRKDIERGEFSRRVLTFKDGKLVKEETFGTLGRKGGQKDVIPITTTSFGEEGKVTTQSFKDGKLFSVVEGGIRTFQAKRQTTLQKQAEIKKLQEARAERLGTEPPEQKDLKLARSLTEEAQRKEFGRVLVKTDTRLQREARVRGVTPEQLQLSFSLTPREQERRFGRVVTERGGLTPTQRLALRIPDAEEISFVSGASTLFSPEVSRKAQEALTKERAKVLAEDIRAIGGSFQGRTVVLFKPEGTLTGKRRVTFRVLGIGEDPPKDFQVLETIPQRRPTRKEIKRLKTEPEFRVTGEEAQRLEERISGGAISIIKPGDPIALARGAEEIAGSILRGTSQVLFEAPRIISEPSRARKRIRTLISDPDVQTVGSITLFALGGKKLQKVAPKVARFAFRTFETALGVRAVSKGLAPEPTVEFLAVAAIRGKTKTKAQRQAEEVLRKVREEPPGRLTGEQFFGQEVIQATRRGGIRRILPGGTRETPGIVPSELVEVTRPKPTIVVAKGGSSRLISKRLTPQQTAIKLIEEGKISSVRRLEPKEFERQFGKKSVGVFIPEPSIRRLFPGGTARTEILKPKIFIKNSKEHNLVSTLQHELLHLKFPRKTEGQILKLEETTKGFKVDKPRIEKDIITLPGGEQFTTLRLRGRGKEPDSFVRIKTSPTGESIVKVFREDKLLRQFKTQTEPNIVFGEDIIKVEAKGQFIQIPEFTFEQRARLVSGRIQPTLTPLEGGLQPVGRRRTIARETLEVGTISPETTTILRPGRPSPTRQEVRVGESVFEFVRQPTPSRVRVEEISPREVSIFQPVISGTRQKIDLESRFVIDFVEPIKPRARALTPRPTKKPLDEFEIKLQRNIDEKNFKDVLSAIREGAKRDLIKLNKKEKTLLSKSEKEITGSTTSRETFNKIINRLSNKDKDLILTEEFVQVSVQPPGRVPGFRLTEPGTILSGLRQAPQRITPRGLSRQDQDRLLVQQAQEQLQRQRLTSVLAQGQINILESIQTPAQIQRQIQTPIQEQVRRQIQRKVQTPIQTQIQTPIQAQVQIQIQKPISILTPAQIQTPVQILVPTPIVPPPIIPTPSQKVRRLKEKLVAVKRQQGYDVLIKDKIVKGKKPSFTRANKRRLTREGAEGMGMKITDSFSERSFIIKQSGTTTKQNPKLKALKNRLQHKFRKSVKDKNIFVEKRTFAIDSPGELKEITFEGLKQRQRNTFLNKVRRPTLKKRKVTKRKQTKRRTPRQPQIRFL